jgi:hypothetical protein
MSAPPRSSGHVVIPSARKAAMCSPWFSLEAGGWIPRVSWRDDDGTIHMIDGPGAFTTWREADEASRFLVASIRTSNRTEEGAMH